ncbi:MAG: hypothetical protein JWM59_5012 [Verrucomicrobiales bacterium]|nr:hypothetical protein [Verrucomicrobiales bacterium]
MKKASINPHGKVKRIAKAAAGCLLFIGATTLLAGEISLTNLEAVYDGGAKQPQAVTVPASLPFTFYYRDSSLPEIPGVAQVVFQNRSDTLELSYYSVPLSGEKIEQMGDIIWLGTGARELESCQTTLVSYAKAQKYPALAAANPAGYPHPVTINIYRVTETGGQIIPITSMTSTVLVPWRPETLPDGKPYPYNGTAFRADIPFPPGTVLPERVLVGVEIPNSKAGRPKLPAVGPYDGLNLALSNPGASVGANEDANTSYLMRDNTWYASNISGPMLRLTAKAPQGETTQAPVNAGTYYVRAAITKQDEVSQAGGLFVISKAPADITLSTVNFPESPVSWEVTIGGQPADLPVRVTYNGSEEVPDQPGVYKVVATVTDPNHEGRASGVVWIGNLYEAWIRQRTEGSGTAEELLSAASDPDGDGVSNLLEYAFAGSPLVADGGGSLSPVLEVSGSDLFLTWQENPNAADITLTIERTGTAEESASWLPVQPLARTVIRESADVRVVKATLPSPDSGANRSFLRLRASRH